MGSHGFWSHSFYFFSNEGQEPAHIHVQAGGDQCKFWLEPVIRLAVNHGFAARELNEIARIVTQQQHTLLEHGMTTSANHKARASCAYVPTVALAKSLSFDDELMHVTLTDGRVISVPLIWFPILFASTSDQRLRYEIGMGGRSLHWPELDEDLAVGQLLAGADPVST